MDIALWVLQAILAIKCLSSAVIHGLQPNMESMRLAAHKFGRRARVLTGLAGAGMGMAALGLVAPAVFRTAGWVALLAAATLAVMLLLSIPLHIKSREKPLVFVSLVLLAFCAVVVYGRLALAPF